VELAYRLALGRRPTAGELRRVADYISAFGDAAPAPAVKSPGGRNGNDRANGRNADKLRTDAWATFCQALFASAEFRYLN
jgi:hypothetical protein